MNSISLVLIVHDHQPVGNFDGVFRRCYEDAYDPFLRFLESHPHLRLALHTSGPLLQWIALHEPGYLPRLRTLVERGQVELWGGGFFEPVLPAIPEVDRRGQVRAMADWLELELGERPRGLWLTERVWEPGLASSLHAAGVEYTAVDDAHFVAAGFERDQLWGWYHTEDQGQALKIFPIHRELRYAIPFEEPEKTIELLSRVAAGGAGRIAVLGDDGEKFGVWPGTKKRVFEDGWLERWLAAIEANPWIVLRTPAEAIAHHESLGLAYLPTASYHEMQEWSLPPASARRYHGAAEKLAADFGDAAHDLLRGGHWRNFLARYPESNRIHKRMLRSSRALWRHPNESDEAWREARTHLWKAQCNCPYWHGVFGGLYLPHLRSAVYRELIAAESWKAPEAFRIEDADLDLDGVGDALLETPRWAAWISLRGGRLWAFDDRQTLTNYGDTLARRPELYHDQLAQAAERGREGHAGAETIHAGIRLKDPSVVADVGAPDSDERDSFLDRWSEGGERHDWSRSRFTRIPDDVAVALHVAEAGAPELSKRYAVASDASLEVVYRLTSARRREGTLEIQLNLGLHVPNADDRWVEVNERRATPSHFAARARDEGATHAAFVDAWAQRRLDLWWDRPSSLERAPIETLSLSEAGVERVFQGVELRVACPVELEPGRPFELRFRVRPKRLPAGAA